MDAGRELDALVAERVMGWVIWDAIAHRGEPPDKLELVSVSHYSTDIAAAWQVVEWAQHRFRYSTAVRLTKVGDEWRCDMDITPGVYDDPGETVMWSADAPTAPHAICLAALKACGVVL